MKKLFGLFAIALFAPLIAFSSSSPYSPEIDKRFKEVETVKHKAIVYRSLFMGSSVATHGLDITLPAGAKIKDGFIYFNTQFVDDGSGTLALQCEDTGNLLTAVDVTGHAAGSIIALNQSTITNATRIINTTIASPCEVSAVVAGTALTAGTLTIYLDFIVKKDEF